MCLHRLPRLLVCAPALLVISAFAAKSTAAIHHYTNVTMDPAQKKDWILEYFLWVSNDNSAYSRLGADTPNTMYRRGWSAAGEPVVPGASEPAGQGSSGHTADVPNDDYSAQTPRLSTDQSTCDGIGAMSLTGPRTGVKSRGASHDDPISWPLISQSCRA